MSTINEFRSYLTQGGARPSQFEVLLAFPSFAGSGDAARHAKFMCVGASLPASTIQSIEVPYRGRMIKVAGERSFQNWQVTILNDGNFVIRKALEKWSQAILNHGSTAGIVTPGGASGYAVDLEVKQLGRADSYNAAEQTQRHYVFHNCYPINVGEIQLDFGDTQQIEKFQVEFSVDYWTTKDNEIV